MNLCDDGHDEVCFDVKKCPLCRLQSDIDVLNERITDLEKENKDLEEQLDAALGGM